MKKKCFGRSSPIHLRFISDSKPETKFLHLHYHPQVDAKSHDKREHQNYHQSCMHDFECHRSSDSANIVPAQNLLAYG